VKRVVIAGGSGFIGRAIEATLRERGYDVVILTRSPRRPNEFSWDGRTVGDWLSVVDGAPSTPNGVTLSPDEKTLYVSGNGLKKFPVMTDGSLGTGSDFVAGSGGDGMAVDCAGDLFVTGNNTATVRVYSPAAALLATIQLPSGAGNTTNVAFGGSDHKTLYITAQGTETQRGVYSIAVSVPGFPY